MASLAVIGLVDTFFFLSFFLFCEGEQNLEGKSRQSLSVRFRFDYLYKFRVGDTDPVFTM